MNKYLKKTLALALVLSVLSGCAKSDEMPQESTAEQTEAVTTTTYPLVTLAPEEEQVINEIPATYENLGVDREAVESFEAEIADSYDIPVVSVTTSEEILSREIYVSCVVDVFNVDDSLVINEASAGIKVRGNSSAYYGDANQIRRNKAPYRIKFDTKTNMLGLNDGAECKSWVLLKADWDLVKNDIAFRFGRAIMGEENYCSDSQLVHLYVNQEFYGVYLLCEQCQINPDRVDISEPEKDYGGVDIGYYLELDNYAASEEGNRYLTMDYEEAVVTDIEGTTRQFVPAEYSIKNDLYSQNQIDFIEKYMNNLFEIVYLACEQGEYYAFDANYDLVESQFENAEDTVNAVMDVQSVVDLYMLYEIVHDYDCGEGSFYMCVDFSAQSNCPKLKFTSPWDFNWAYEGSLTEYYAAVFNDQSFVADKGDRSNPWFIILMKQDWFVQMVKEKWTTLQSESVFANCIEEETAYLELYESDLNKGNDGATENAKNLLSWIKKRLRWMDKRFIIQEESAS